MFIDKQQTRHTFWHLERSKLLPRAGPPISTWWVSLPVCVHTSLGMVRARLLAAGISGLYHFGTLPRDYIPKER